MKTVYLVRHGESTENVRSTPVFVGGAAELTDLGREQARRIAERAQRLPIETIVASPYVRARDTAAVIAESTGLGIVESELFIEHKAPTSFIGREWSDEFRADFKKWQNVAYVEGEKYEDGDNFETMRDRASRALDFLLERKEENILVVTHGMFTRVMVGLVMLQEAFLPEDLKKLEHTLITRNTGITVIRHGSDDSRKNANDWHMLTWNDHAHLG